MSFLRSTSSAVIALALLVSAVAPRAVAAVASQAVEPAAPEADEGTRLVAFLSMKPGFGPADHDAYERTIAPIGAEYGMRLEAAYSVAQFLGGSGPRQASTVAVWDLATPESLGAMMSDPRYQAEIPRRDRLHDLPESLMYLVREELSSGPSAASSTLLVGILAMRPGFDFADHVSYEKVVGEAMARHGMRLLRSYRVLQPMSGGPANAAAIGVWELSTPEAMGRVMSDPDYVAVIPYRDRIHDMAATTMYFVTSRAAAR